MKVECEKYDLDKYMIPLWEGNIVYNESVLPVKNKDGKVEPISLTYKADEICEVRSSDLLTLFEEGKDYVLTDGKLCLTDGSGIPSMKYDEYYPVGSENAKPKTGGGNILFIEGGFFHTKQIAVTYTHSEKWDVAIPKKQADLLPKTVDKLKNKKKLTMAFFGDSIYTGCNSSGTPQGGSQEPFMPAWFDMVTEKLKDIFGYDEIEYVNHSRGGRKSFWVDEAPDEIFDRLKADIAWIGYGMNDRQTTLDEYICNIKKMMEKIRRNNPDIEFILTAPMLASKEAEGFYCLQYRFVELLNGLKGNGVAVMDVTTVHARLLERKSYRDTTGNNLNHPNDFLCRIYAQTALNVLLEE